MPSTFLIYNPLDPVGNVLEIKRTAKDQLEPNHKPTGMSWLKVPNDHPAAFDMLKWVVTLGIPTFKQIVGKVVSKSSFVADGLDESVLTFSGMVGDMAISLGNGLTRMITLADAELTITSDVPRIFEIMPGELDLHTFEPFIVEAI